MKMTDAKEMWKMKDKEEIRNHIMRNGGTSAEDIKESFAVTLDRAYKIMHYFMMEQLIEVKADRNDFHKLCTDRFEYDAEATAKSHEFNRRTNMTVEIGGYKISVPKCFSDIRKDSRHLRMYARTGGETVVLQMVQVESDFYQEEFDGTKEETIDALITSSFGRFLLDIEYMDVAGLTSYYVKYVSSQLGKYVINECVTTYNEETNKMVTISLSWTDGIYRDFSEDFRKMIESIELTPTVDITVTGKNERLQIEEIQRNPQFEQLIKEFVQILNRDGYGEKQ